MRPPALLAERGATVQIVVPRPLHVLRAAGSGAIIKPKTRIEVLQPSGEQETARFDRFTDQVRSEDYDVIYLPGHSGGISGTDDQSSVTFLRGAERAGRPIFAAGELAILRAGVVHGFAYTSRDAFDMPVLLDRLIAALLTRPAVMVE